MGLQRAITLARGGPPSQTERSLLDFLEQELPAPHRLWTSIRLFAPSGDSFDIDLIILGHYGLYVVEVKPYGGRISAVDQSWMVTPVGGVPQRVSDPLPLATQKARFLAQLLHQELEATPVPVEAVLVATGSDIEIDLPPKIRTQVLTPRDLVRAIQSGDLPNNSIQGNREPVDEATAAAVQHLLQGVRGRPRPGRGRLQDELPLLVRDISLGLRGRAPETELRASVWMISCTFVRALEERGLLDQNLLAGNGAEEAERAFLAGDPTRSANDYLHHVLDSVMVHPAGGAVLSDYAPLLRETPLSDADARTVLDFFRQRSPSGKRRWSFAGDPWTDLYQQLSRAEREEHAMTATPTFVDELLLDLTLEPALSELGFDATRVMDPACGSGLLLLAAFERIHRHARGASPGADPEASVLSALDRIHGADISPIAVMVTRIRLVLAYLERAKVRRLAEAPRPPLHVVAADSLLEGRGGGTMDERQTCLFAQRFAVVVCEPPFVTCKDRTRRELYQRWYPRSASTPVSLVALFIERCFDLATEGGYVGIFASNSFTKRQFGKPLVEEVLSQIELTRLIDTSGAYIPEHRTPTLLLFGRNRRPRSGTVRVVVSKRGEPIAPIDPAKGEVWSAIVTHRDDVGHEDQYIAVADVPRERLARHPWSLGAGAQSEVKDTIELHSLHRLRDVVSAVGPGASSGQDEVFVVPTHVPARLGLERETIRPYLSAELIQDWAAPTSLAALAPYDESGREPLAADRDANWWRFLWRYRTVLQARTAGGGTRQEPWWAWSRWRAGPSHGGAPRLLGRSIARMNDFVRERGGAVIRASVSIIQWPLQASEDDCFGLLGYLNSSVACFWMKQSSHQKTLLLGDGHSGDNFYDFTETTRDIPIPRPVLESGPLRAEIITLARQLEHAAQERAACAPERVLADWARVSRDDLIEALSGAQMKELACLRQMVCAQENLDWLIYESIGLVDDAYRGVQGSALPEQRPFAWLSDEPPLGLDRRLVQPWRRRREATRGGRVLQVLEDPSYKRRFRRSAMSPDLVIEEADEASESKTEGEARNGRDFQRRMAAACEGWLLDRLEDVYRGLDEPRALEADDLVSRLAAIAGVREVVSLVRDAASDAALAATTRALVEAHAVSYLAAFRHTEAGLVKRALWEQTWQMQRRQDAGEDVHPPVPPRYDAKDYRDIVTWLKRGRLDVPKERFIRYPGAASDGAAAMYGWAGWDAERRAAVAHALCVERRTRDAWEPARLVPLLAGMLELAAERTDSAELEQPMAAVHIELQALGLSIGDLRTFRPSRPRKKKEDRPS